MKFMLNLPIFSKQMDRHGERIPQRSLEQDLTWGPFSKVGFYEKYGFKENLNYI